MNRGVQDGKKRLALPDYLGVGDPANDGKLLQLDSTQPGGVKVLPLGTYSALTLGVNGNVSGAVSPPLGPSRLTLTGDVTLTAPAPLATNEGQVELFIFQDGVGGHAVTWWAGITWLAGVPPTIPTNAGAMIVVNLVSVDGGVSWYGSPSGTGGGLQVLGEATPSGVSSVTFSNIPQTYRRLKVLVVGASDVAANSANVLMQFNNDVGSNYNWVFVSGNNAAAGAASGAAQTAIQVGQVKGANGVAGNSGQMEVLINRYADTTFRKSCLSPSGVAASDTAGSFTALMTYGYWKNTSAVSTVKVSLSAGNFVAGSVVTLIGEG